MKNTLQNSGRLWRLRLLLYFTVSNRQRILEHWHILKSVGLSEG